MFVMPTPVSNLFQLSFGKHTFHPITRLSKPAEYKLINDEGSSLHATHDTIRLCRLESLAIRWPFKSNNLTSRLSCGIATTLFAETASRFTADSVRMCVSAERMLRNSHTLTDRSSLPDTTLSSFVNTADVTLSICPVR